MGGRDRVSAQKAGRLSVTNAVVNWWECDEFTMVDIYIIFATALLVWCMDRTRCQTETRDQDTEKREEKCKKRDDNTLGKSGGVRRSIGDAQLPSPLGTGEPFAIEVTHREGECEAKTSLVEQLCDKLEDSEFTAADVKALVDCLDTCVHDLTVSIDEIVAQLPFSTLAHAKETGGYQDSAHHPTDHKSQDPVVDDGRSVPPPADLLTSEFACRFSEYWHETMGDSGRNGRRPCAVCDLLVSEATCIYLEADALPHKERLAGGDGCQQQPAQWRMTSGDNITDDITSDHYPGDKDGVLDGLVLSKHGFTAAHIWSSVTATGGSNAPPIFSAAAAYDLRVCPVCLVALEKDSVPVDALVKGCWAGGET